MLQQKEIQHPDEVSQRFAHIRGNYMAKAALEGAVWDLYARRQNLSLSKALGGSKSQIEVGLSVGIQPTIDETLRKIEAGLNEGYKRIKIKIKPGWDLNLTRAVRNEFPSTPLMVDANSAYTLADADHLAQLDEFDLMMIEQPLAHDDLIDHAELQARMRTPICLDESIHSAEDVRKAIKLGSTQIINIKIGRVGGLTEAKKFMTFVKLTVCPYGAAACWNQVSDEHIILPLPHLPILRFPEIQPHPLNTGRVISFTRKSQWTTALFPFLIHRELAMNLTMTRYKH